MAKSDICIFLFSECTLNHIFLFCSLWEVSTVLSYAIRDDCYVLG